MMQGPVITKSRRLVAALAMVFAGGLAAPVMAAKPPCALNGVQPVPVLETAKAHFLKGEYPEFCRIATPFLSDAEARYRELFQQMAELFKGGFTDCSTVLQRREAGGMVQELTLFSIRPPGRGVMSLLMTTAPLKEGEKVVFMSFNTQLARVMEQLH